MKEKIANMKKRKGFTLIELLAIIVILAIIAVITVPIVLNIIENSKKASAKDSAYGYKDSINKYYISKLADNPDFMMADGTYAVGDLDATTEGKQPGNNSWVTITKNKVTGGCLQFDEYKVEIESEIVKDAVKGECQPANSSSEPGDEPEETVGIPLTIGDSVAYSTTLNNVPLNTWKVFLSDENYTYLIYSGYLPVTAIDMDEIMEYEYSAYSVYPQVNAYDSEVARNVIEDDFISVMLDKSNWDSLLEGTLNGTISINQKSNNNTMAMASPTIELWRDSWNAKYNDEGIIIQYLDDEENYLDGWAVNTLDTDEENLWFSTYADLSETVGYSDSLYFPFKDTPEGTSGYFLSSKALNVNTPTPIYVYEGGYVGGGYDDGDYAFRPVIKLPTSIVNPQ